ncbi:MAG: Crp/Fnr family transcriptional regulator, partial [Acidimicrobiales bacterium]
MTIPTGLVERLIAEAALRCVASGDHVVRAGAEASHLAVLIDGVAVVRHPSRPGVTLDVLEGTTVVGDTAALLGTPHAHDVVARGDVEVAMVDRLALATLLSRDPNAARWWIGRLAAEVDRGRGRVAELLAGPLEERVAMFLRRRAVRGRVTISQAEIADELGVQRTSVSAALAKLRDDGTVTLGYRTIDLTDWSRAAATP